MGLGENYTDGKYFNFPIMLLKPGIHNLKTVLEDIMCFGLYVETNKNGYELVPIETKLKLADIFNINWKKRHYERGEIIFNSVPAKFGPAGLKRDTIWEYYTEEKTEFEKVTLMAYAALKSIMYKKEIYKITNRFFLSRIAGNSKANEPLPEWIKKYSTRYQLEKIKKELRDNWHVSYYAYHTRGFYVSFKLSNQKLMEAVELKRKERKDKDKLYQQKAKEIRQKIHGTTV